MEPSTAELLGPIPNQRPPFWEPVTNTDRIAHEKIAFIWSHDLLDKAEGIKEAKWLFRQVRERIFPGNFRLGQRLDAAVCEVYTELMTARSKRAKKQLQKASK